MLTCNYVAPLVGEKLDRWQREKESAAEKYAPADNSGRSKTISVRRIVLLRLVTCSDV